MGALTLKSFPFELRGWDIEEYESIDPTDSFGSNIRVYVSKDQIVQIEPDYDNHTSNTWITDKGRQFFDGIFKDTNLDQKIEKSIWLKILRNLTQNIYIFQLCNNQLFKNCFLTIVFQNISLEILSLLNIIAHNYSFVKVRKIENIKVDNDLESNFQLNLISDKTKLNNSDICLLISTNTRYQGYLLNLNLRQRFFKGNFKCILIGSLIDITFPLSYLGSDNKVLKNIVEGNNLNCRDIIESKNPFFILNDEILKRNDNLTYMLQSLKNMPVSRPNWNGFNFLNSSLSSVGELSLNNFLSFNSKDFLNFSSLYLINVNFNQFPDFKKIIKLKLLNYLCVKNKEILIKKLIIDQSTYNNENLTNIFTDELKFYVPTSMFFENNSTFINTQGLIKRTTKVSFDKKTRNNWQILRKFFKNSQKKTSFLLGKDNLMLNFNCNNNSNFQNFTNFHYSATQNLTNMSYYLNIQNNKFFIKNPKFKMENKKIYNTKFKYWLDDFFIGGKDDYSHNSLILANCSKIIRTESTNFF